MSEENDLVTIHKELLQENGELKREVKILREALLEQDNLLKNIEKDIDKLGEMLALR